MTTTTAALERQDQQVEVTIVDCDVHLVPKAKDELLKRMPDRLRRRVGTRLANNSSGKEGYAAYAAARRLDSMPANGNPAGSEPDLVYKQLFEDAGVDLAILIPEMRYTVDPEVNRGLYRAFNQWVAETWLGEWNLDERLFGTISVSLDDVAAAVDEIHEWGPDPRFKQILISNYSHRPLGFPQYEPVWEAASRYRLPISMHNTAYAAGAIGSTPAGRFQHWVDFHSLAFPLMYCAHMVSWLCSGVFDRYPEMRVVFVEGGYLWHRPIVARLSRHWEAFQPEVGAGDRDPLEVVRQHVRFTTQPIEESDQPRDAARLIELADAAHTLMLSTDYPHHDYDEPRRALPAGLDKDVCDRIMRQNALELYDLPRWRPARPHEIGQAGR